MTPEQTQYFENRSSGYQGGYSADQLVGMEISPTFTLADTINKAVVEYVRSTTISLRADAYFLIHLNFEEAVFAPLSKSLEHVRLLQAIYRDTKVILTEAGAIAQKNSDIAVSGHAVLQAIAVKWDILETLGKGSW